MSRLFFIAILLGVIGFLSWGTYLNYSNQFSNKNVGLTKSSEKYEIETFEVTYYKNVKGFYAKPKKSGNFPGVVMIHEWWGLNDNIKEMAKQLASQGYKVIAVDLFGTVATTPDEAIKQVSSLNQDEALNNMKSAIDYLQGQGAVKIGSLGWCFGGAQSLQISLVRDIDATIIYYGNLVEDKERLKNLKSPVLGIFGDEDTTIPSEKVKNFENTLKEYKYENNIYLYEGVGHAFANPSGRNYAPEQTKDAWEKTLQFLDEKLK